MLPISLLVLLTFFYLILLFTIAYIGDKYTISSKVKPAVYSLGLGVIARHGHFMVLQVKQLKRVGG